MTFIGEDYESNFMHGILEFNPENKRPAADALDNGVRGPMTALELSPGIIKIKRPFRKLPRIGSIVSIKHEQRYVPAISIDSSKNIRLENITVYHAGTMGVVAQFTENIRLEQFKVCLEPGTDRVVSANADATHFVGCSGEILIQNSLFENQLDDILNVHGNYLRIHSIFSNNHVIAEIPHKQQVGAFSLKIGTEISILADHTMAKKFETVVKSIQVLNNKFYEIHFEDHCDFIPDQGYCIEDIDAYPSLRFINNKGGKNRARGLLLTSAKDILIEHNDLYCEGINRFSRPIKDYGIPMLPRLFAEKGYRTAYIGKMHFSPVKEHHGYGDRITMEEIPKKLEDDDYALFLKANGDGHIQNIHGLRPLAYHTPQKNGSGESILELEVELSSNKNIDILTPTQSWTFIDDKKIGVKGKSLNFEFIMPNGTVDALLDFDWKFSLK